MIKEPGCGCLRHPTTYALLESLTPLQSGKMLLFDLHFIGQGELLTDVDLTGLHICRASLPFVQNSFYQLIFRLCFSAHLLCLVLDKTQYNQSEYKNVISFQLSNWEMIDFYTLFSIVCQNKKTNTSQCYFVYVLHFQ